MCTCIYYRGLYENRLVSVSEQELTIKALLLMCEPQSSWCWYDCCVGVYACGSPSSARVLCPHRTMVGPVAAVMLVATTHTTDRSSGKVSKSRQRQFSGCQVGKFMFTAVWWGLRGDGRAKFYNMCIYNSIINPSLLNRKKLQLFAYNEYEFMKIFLFFLRTIF